MWINTLSFALMGLNSSETEVIMIIKCAKCAQKNKIPATKLGEHPKCGACKTTIDSYAYPANITEKEFDAAIQNAPGLVVVDFWSPTCGPCLMAAPELDKYAKAHPEVLVLKANANENMKILQRFGIRGVPTFKVFSKGKEVREAVGYLDLAQMETQFKIS